MRRTQLPCQPARPAEGIDPTRILGFLAAEKEQQVCLALLPRTTLAGSVLQHAGCLPSGRASEKSVWTAVTDVFEQVVARQLPATSAAGMAAAEACSIAVAVSAALCLTAPCPASGRRPSFVSSCHYFLLLWTISVPANHQWT